ncbi:MAG: hypothetical protein FJZ87_02780 [Chloroflexi bacterium]|nr:hypothetical protein [Chloroflexota bacterium]
MVDSTSRKRISQILLLFLGATAIVYCWMYVVRRTLPAAPPGTVADLYKGVPPETNPWLEPWQRWDTPHYQAIAERGYGAFDTALFTPPLYPLLMRLFAPAFRGNTLASGLIISGLGFLGCLVALYSLARLELPEEKDAFRAVTYLAFFPTAFFLAAAYSESIFLLMVILGFYCVRRNQWAAAGLFGALAGLTRTPGALMTIPLAWAAWEARGTAGHRAWLAPVLAGLGSMVFPLYVRFGLGLPPTAILDALNARGGHLAFIGWNLIVASSRILQGWLWQENLIELFFSLLFIVLTVDIWKRLPRIYGIYSVCLMVLFLSRLGAPQPLSSMARYVLEIVPAFMLLALWGREARLNRIILYPSWMGLLFFSAQFAIWGWVG